MIDLHCHTDYSNIRLLDAITTVEELILGAHENGKSGVALTEHESVASHVKAIQTTRKLKEQGKIPQDFKLVLGNEIYLVDSLEEVRDNYQSGVTKFPHFLLLAKDKEAHEALRWLSSEAWKNCFKTGIMDRVPTTKESLVEAVKNYPNRLIGSSACFLEDAQVAVDGKLTHITEVVAGDVVNTHKGNKKEVISPTSRHYSGKINTIKTKGSTFNITATENHKFLTIESQKSLKRISDFQDDYCKTAYDFYKGNYLTKSRRDSEIKRMASSYEPKWTEAKDLSAEHTLLREIDDLVEDIDYIELSKYHKENSKKRLPNRISIDEDFLWILGFYIAEGSMSSMKSGINFATHENKLYAQNRIINYFTKLGLHVSHHKKNYGKGYSLTISSIELFAWFSDMFEQGAINKKVPDFIKRLPLEKQMHFLRGYFQGDGHYRNRTGRGRGTYEVGFSTISQQLAYDITGIVARFGLNMLIATNPARKDKNGVNHQEYYMVNLSGKVAKKFIDAVFYERELNIQPEDVMFKDIPFLWQGRKYLRCPVVSNTVKHYDGKVYCLNVKEDHSFEVEGSLVHNCLGSESSIHILNDDYDKARDFLKWCSNLFGKGNFYLELQPSKSNEQRKVNEWLIKFSKELDLDLIITSDVHYLRPEDAKIHEAFLNAKEGDREVSSFYESCYLHTSNEIYTKLDYLDKEIISEAMQNTLKIGEMIEDYTIEAPTVLPRIELPEFKLKHIFEKGYEKYPYISNMARSKDEQDRYLLYLIENGFIEHIPYSTLTKDEFHKILARIDVELQQLWEMSEKLNQAMSSYYVTVAKIVELMWGDDDCDSSREEGSLVGSGRGSAVSWITNFLLGITQVNPMQYGIEIPYWRHLASEMSSISSLDIDLDINGIKKNHIFERIKKSFGEDRFLQVCTYGTEKSKSALQTACRGLGYDVEIGQYLGSMIPFSRGENWTIHECLYGDEEEGKEPIQQFINEIEKYPNLKETALKISGLVNKRSIHAGGVLILNESYYKTNALMRAPNGSFVSQFNLDDSQAVSNIKYDILTIESLQKIQTAMDFLLDAGEIEWQGSLRKTFNKYFHPEIIDKESPELFELASSGTVPDLFQFSTIVGHSAITKAKPTNLIEMASANSLMRLQTNGEQPIDTFVRFKEDIGLWYEEMRNWGLNEEEIKIMEEHLLPLNGVADTQESVMLLSMDNRIASFGIKEATDLRKSIASKSDDVAKAIKKVLFDSGVNQGTRKEMLNYVWYQISRMLSYAFSSPHTLAYTLIAMIQLTLVTKHNPIYWSTAVLTVNSGSQEVEEGEKAKSTDYGKVAAAIGDLKQNGTVIELPLINSANFGFTPDIENSRIIYSLKGIVGVGDNIVNEIIENRPYLSFDDFYERLYTTKKVQRSHVLKLIKAGSFNEFNTPIEIMKEFLVKETPVKEALNGQNMSRVINLGLFNSNELKKYQDYFNFRSFLKKYVHKKLVNPKNRILIIKDEHSKKFFTENFSDESIYDFMGDSILIDEKEFEKEYKQLMNPAMNLLNDKEFIRQFNIAQFRELWGEHASGSVPQWEMESVSFYSDKHELEDANLEQYGVRDFNSLPEEPVIVGEYEYKGQTRYNYELCSIAGTVLDKNDNSHTVTLLTPTGVVTVKTWGGRFSFYNRQIKHNGKIVEKSWFTRGELLMFTGYRSNDLFILNAPKGQHTVNRITEIREDGSLGLQSERFRA